MKTLILVITKDCNFDCRYCNVNKKKEYMQEEIATRAVEIFLNRELVNRNEVLLIRFFGGEPLLNWGIFRKTVEFVEGIGKDKKIDIIYDITTNGVLLDEDKLNFLKDHPNIELKISLDGDKYSQNLNRKNIGESNNSYDKIIGLKSKIFDLSNFTINMVISPNTVKSFYSNFVHIVNNKFNKINILPALYVYWSNEEIDLFIKGLQDVYKFIKKNPKVTIKNIFYDSETPLFNNEMVVDCDGSVFDTNIFMSKTADRFYDDLKIGNIAKDTNFEKKEDNYNELLQKIFGDKVYYSSKKVDTALYYFVEKIKLLNKN